jgi:hypothetical protein
MTEDQNVKDNRYRKIIEHEAQMMDDFAQRLGNQEVVSASIRSDVKSLGGQMTGISNKLDMMVDRNRPNTLALFAAAFGAVSLMMTIGVLAFSPVYKNIDQIVEGDQRRQEVIEGIISSRFTPDDAREVAANHTADILEMKEVLSTRLYRNESELIELTKKVSFLDGKHVGEHKE